MLAGRIVHVGALAAGVDRRHALAALVLAQVGTRIVAIGALGFGVRALLVGFLLGLGVVAILCRFFADFSEFKIFMGRSSNSVLWVGRGT